MFFFAPSNKKGKSSWLSVSLPWLAGAEPSFQLLLCSSLSTRQIEKNNGSYHLCTPKDLKDPPSWKGLRFEPV